jgi:hypothetical protein
MMVGGVLIYDIIRAVVMLEAVIMVGFFTRIAWGSWEAWRQSNETILRHISLGRFFSSVGIVLLLINEITDVVARMGNETMNWKTPFLQLTMITLTFGYWYRDRVSISGSVR